MTTHQPQVGDTITTTEELDALPSQAAVGSLFDGSVFDVAQRATDPEWDGGRAWYVAGSRECISPSALLPAVVLYIPGHPPRPERAVKAEALPLDTLDAIVEHLMADGTRDGLIHANTLNWTFGRSARRLAARIEAGETR